jgi:hypothetical protein
VSEHESAKPGTSLANPRAKMPILERLLGMVSMEPNTGCWLWLGSVAKTGYARFGMGHGRPMLAHRISYMIHFGSIPDDLELDHKCHTRCCVNPLHLEPVTHLENVRRGIAINGKNRGRVGGYNGAAEFQKSKTHCPKGHAYDESNTRLTQDGSYHQQRVCRACDRARGGKAKRAIARTLRIY